MEVHEYGIMKALLKRLYQENLISTNTYSQTINQLDFELDNAPTPSYTATTIGREAFHKHGTLSN